MAIAPDRLLDVLGSAGRPLGLKELLRLGGLHSGEQTEVKRALRELLRKGAVQKEGKRFLLPKEAKAAHPEPSAPEQPHAPRRGRSHERGREGPAFGVQRRETEERHRAGRPPSGARPRPGAGEPGPRAHRGQTVAGILHVHRDGFGFVHPLSGEGENIYLPAHEASRAIDGDRVAVAVSQRGGRSSGELVEVLQRRRAQVVGTYFDRGRSSFVSPHDQSLGPIRVPQTQLGRDGDLVKVTLGVGAELVEAGEGLHGEVSGSLGRPGDPSGEVLGIVFSEGFSDELPPEVMEEADRIPLHVSPEEADGRRDLRDLPLVTIDGADARDFDDAVHAEDRPFGWRLVVAIADVSHYVREGTALDREAVSRATSVYLPGRVLPMLPERLSAGICSLKPDEDRLCMVADLEIDRQGRTRRTELYPAVMRSHARCTYGEVQAVLDGEDVPHRNAFRPAFERLLALSKVLTKMRMERGALDFELPEVRVVLEAGEVPVRMERREREDAHRLIEECMLAANEAVARFFRESGEPTVYRFHAEPDEEKLATFAELAGAYGFNLPPKGKLTSKALAGFLERLEGHPEERALNQLLLRSMMQAVYSATNVGHYGLAAENYLHFTSPIRRYPDLLVHRQLKKIWARGGQPLDGEAAEAETERLEALAVQSSQRERAAMQVEREVSAYYAAVMMKDRVGEEFKAAVAAVTDFGFFVQLEEEMVEGLVKAEALGPGARLDPRLHALRYPNGRKIRVGQRLTVRLDSVNLQRRQLDFSPLAFEGEEPLDTRQVARGAEHPHRRRRGEQPPIQAPGAPHALPPAGVSAHPGFDRLRALAAQDGKAPHKPARPEKHPPRAEEKHAPRAEEKRGRKERGARKGGGHPSGGGKRGGRGGGPRRQR